MKSQSHWGGPSSAAIGRSQTQTLASDCINIAEPVTIIVGLPGIVPAQHAAYAATILDHLDLLSDRVDLSGLGSATITTSYAAEIYRRGLDVSLTAKGHVAASYVSQDECTAHVILDFAALSGLLNKSAGDHPRSLQILAVAVAQAHCSWLLDQDYGSDFDGGPHQRWNEIGRDCFLAFVGGRLTFGIDKDAEASELNRAEISASYIKAAGLWIEATSQSSYLAHHALNLCGAYADLFVAVSRWLGQRTAACQAVACEIS